MTPTREKRDFVRCEGPDGVVLWVDPLLESDARALGLLERIGLGIALSRADGPRGRGATAVLALPTSGGRLHLRPLRRGGWLGGILDRRLWSLSRPVSELRVTARLRDLGAPVPRPALVSGFRVGWFWQAAVGTLHEEDCVDGLQFLASQPPAERILDVARRAGAAVRRFHDLGGRHNDLHAGNLLVRHPAALEPDVLVVDLDKARVKTRVSARRRAAELTRLLRSLRKHGHLDRIGRRGISAFMAGYTGGDRALRTPLMRFARRRRWRIGLHTLGYAAKRVQKDPYRTEAGNSDDRLIR